jgi:hypothetical protein
MPMMEETYAVPTGQRPFFRRAGGATHSSLHKKKVMRVIIIMPFPFHKSDTPTRNPSKFVRITHLQKKQLNI